MKNRRVVIVEDDEGLRKSLTGWLSKDYEVIGYESAEAFITASEDYEFEDGIPTCMLLDFQMPGANGVELQRTLKEINIEFPIIFMSGNAHQADVIDAWRGGAVDFILKPFSGEQVSESLEKLFSNLNQFQKTNSKIKKDLKLVDIPISAREAEVLLLLGQGYRQAEVAQKLGIGLRTIKMHRTNLKNKLNLHTPVELVRFCDLHSILIKKILGETS